MSQSQLATLKSRLSNVYAKRREHAETLMETGAEIVSGALYGAADQRYGSSAIMGASVPLVAGIVATGASLFGVGGSANGVLMAVGRAGLVVEAYRRGGEMYREWDERPES